MGQVIRKSMDEMWKGVVVGDDGKILDVEINLREDQFSVDGVWHGYVDIMDVIELIKEM